MEALCGSSGRRTLKSKAAVPAGSGGTDELGLSSPSQSTSPPRLKLLVGGLVLFNLLSWIVFAVVGRAYHSMLWTGVLAYSLGLQHAFDADHIAAIDNVTRKLRQDGQRPVAVGFFFALGHSVVVYVLSLGLVMLVSGPFGMRRSAQALGYLISRVASAGFLTIIGLLNLVVVRHLWLQLRANQGNRSRAASVAHAAKATALSGAYGRLVLFFQRHIDASWKMLLVGMLFAVGFDTASEAALFGVSTATAAGQHIALWAVMLLPLLFAAGMTLVDSADGILMAKAYDWASGDINAKLIFNLTITWMSVLVAFSVAGIEWLQLLSHRLQLTGPIWTAVIELNFETLGFFIVGLMLTTWAVAALYCKRSRVPSAFTELSTGAIETEYDR